MKRAAIIFILAIFCASHALAQEGVTRQQWKQLTETNDSKQSGEVGEEVPFGSGEPETQKQEAPAAENPQKETTPAQAPAQAADKPANNAGSENYTTSVLLQGLNKITARASKFEVKLEQPVKFGNLSITLHACWKSPPEEAAESKALLEMWEEIPGESRKKIFSGWMFASSPLISAPEHPIYDITVLECKGS